MRGNRLLSGIDPPIVQRFRKTPWVFASNDNVDYIPNCRCHNDFYLYYNDCLYLCTRSNSGTTLPFQVLSFTHSIPASMEWFFQLTTWQGLLTLDKQRYLFLDTLISGAHFRQSPMQSRSIRLFAWNETCREKSFLLQLPSSMYGFSQVHVSRCQGRFITQSERQLPMSSSIARNWSSIPKQKDIDWVFWMEDEARAHQQKGMYIHTSSMSNLSSHLLIWYRKSRIVIFPRLYASLIAQRLPTFD